MRYLAGSVKLNNDTVSKKMKSDNRGHGGHHPNYKKEKKVKRSQGWGIPTSGSPKPHPGSRGIAK